MDHNIVLEGLCYRLLPVKVEDAQFIIDIRLEDLERNRFVHRISNDYKQQESWIKEYLNREGDYYFIIENKTNGKKEGLISVYNVEGDVAEWGRWVLKEGSLAAVESVYLLFKVAFETIGLSKLYCQTIINNKNVVSFHDSVGEQRECVLNDFFEIDGIYYDVVKHFVTKTMFENSISALLLEKAERIYDRSLKALFGGLSFDHIGIASNNIDRDVSVFSLLGFMKGDSFMDNYQGVKGCFLEKSGFPRLEILEDLTGSSTLVPYLKTKTKMYHLAYIVKNIRAAQDYFVRNRAKIISPIAESVYFKSNICFLLLPNMMMIELIEER